MNAVQVASIQTKQNVNCLLASKDGLWYGTYQHEGGEERHGDVSYVALGSTVASRTCSAESNVMPGVFDMKWESDSGRMAVCCTDGSVRWLHADNDAIVEVDKSIVDTEMVTSCVTSSLSLFATSHGGTLTMQEKRDEGWQTVSQWNGHEFDAWCAERWGSIGCEERTYLSGGDDGTMKLWDMRSTQRAMLTRRFDAGVVTIVDTHHDGVHCAVGSYDEHLYLFDMRSTKVPVSDVHVEGGAWRCREIVSTNLQSRHFCVAAMQRGAVIVELQSDGQLHVVCNFHEQDNVVGDGEVKEVLVYDCVPLPVNDATGEILVSSCSFYNRVIATWRLQLP